MSIPMEQLAVIFDTEENTLSLQKRPVPTPNENELLIKVAATAITNGELTWKPFLDWGKEQIPSYDVVGTVVAAPMGNNRFKVGDEVYGRVDAAREGAAREWATLLLSEAAIRPANLETEHAAVVPMSALTAWQGLFTQGGLREPDIDGPVGAENGKKRVLITAASGGVGMLAVQFAKLTGAHVVGTCSAGNMDFVLHLGADEAVDYKSTSLIDWVGGDESKKFDVVFDCAGRKSLDEAWFVIKKGGVLVNIAPPFKEPEGGAPEGVKGWFFVMESDGKQLEKISRFIEKGKIRTVVDKVFPLKEFQKAFDRLASGQARGKVVLKP